MAVRFKMLFGFAIVASIVFIAAVGILPNMQLGWKTYSDPEGRFSIKYPANCNMEPSSELMLSSKGLMLCRENSAYQPSLSIYFSPWALAEKQVVSANYQIPVDQLSAASEEITGLKMITIKIDKGLPINYHSMDVGNGSLIFVARGERPEKIFRQMIGTLQLGR